MSWRQTAVRDVPCHPPIRGGSPRILASETVEAVARRMSSRYELALGIEDAGVLVGLLGWDDLVRFALAHVDPRWFEPASLAARPDQAITPMASPLVVARVHTLYDAAVAIVQFAPRHLDGQNDAIQFVLPGGIGAPSDLLRAIFG